MREHIKEYLVVEYKKGKVRLHDSYRRFGDNNTTTTQTDPAERAFVWFVENILVECGGTATRKCAFRELKTKKEIGEIFTSMDEAWALLVLLNEHHLWEWDWQNPPPKRPNDSDDIGWGGRMKKKPRGRASKPPGAPKKTFTDWKRGSSDGWGDIGRDAFAQILGLVEARRAEDASKEWETRFMCDEREAIMRDQNNDEDSITSTISSSGSSEEIRFSRKPIQSYEGDHFWSVQAIEFAEL